MELLLWILLDIFPTLIVVATWNTIFHGRGTIGGFSLSQLLMYYLSVLTVMNLTEVHFDERWTELVRYGKIDFYLIKPISMPIYIFCETLGRKIIACITFVIPFSLLFFTLMRIGLITTPNITLEKIVIFFLFILGAFVLNYLLSLFIVLAAFWMDEANSLGHFKWMITGLFGGSLAPLAFYPQWIQRIANVLPFKQTLAVPATILGSSSSLHDYLNDLSILMLYLVVFLLAARFLWKKALYKYCSSGG